jgi:hypothetical protein
MSNAVNFQQDLLRLVNTQAGTVPISGLISAVTQPGADQVPASSVNPADPAASDAVGQLSRELESLRRQLGAAEETARRQADLLEQNTRAVLLSNSRPESTLAATARDAVSTVRNSGGLGLLSSPIAGLVNWLTNRSVSAEPDPVPYSQPAPIDGNLGLSSTAGTAPVTYRADGLPRQTPAAAPAQAPNITIHVQTMDSRSFLDNSDQIASAVREAMLNSHSLNDVIGEM